MSRKLVCGVGINDADYRVEHRETVGYVNGKQKQKLLWRCPFYQTWKDMLTRCFSEKFVAKFPTYIECASHESWYLFSNFRLWMAGQDWEGNHLDKDLLFPGNKVYSPDTCIFVSQDVNNFLLDHKVTARQYPIGVCFHSRVERLVVQCKQLSGRSKTLGYFDDPVEAHAVWLTEKLRLAKVLAISQLDSRIASALVERYENFHDYFTIYGIPIRDKIKC